MIHKLVFVVDTNCLISASILPHSLTRGAVNKAIEIGKLVRCSQTLDEFETRIFKGKFDKYLTEEERIGAINRFESISELISVSTQITACRDPDDDKFLSLAIAANADCLITDDKDLLVLHPFRGIPILSPAQFLQSF